MAKRIYKYQFETASLVEIEMPKGAEILSVQVQKNVPCIWAIVDTEAEMQKRLFEIYGTGYSVNENYPKKYISTYQELEGDLVWHIFEITS